MKNFKIYSVLLIAFLLFNHVDLLAQRNNGHKDSEKSRKEYYKKQEKNKKQYQKNHKNDNRNRYDDRNYSYSKGKKRNGPPSWAPAHGYRAKNHVYFRDYYTF
jgi:hypothetical protein